MPLARLPSQPREATRAILSRVATRTPVVAEPRRAKSPDTAAARAELPAAQEELAVAPPVDVVEP